LCAAAAVAAAGHARAQAPAPRQAPSQAPSRPPDQAPGQVYDIPAQRADEALQEFARQAGRQILFPYAEAIKHQAPALRGRYTEREALQLLARAAGLAVAINDERTIALVVDKGPIPALVDRILGRNRPVLARPAEAAPVMAEVELLDEIIVTANRKSDLLGRVPLSISAVTQHAMDQTGVENLQDLSRTVISLAFRRNNNEGNPNVAIRGIASQLGAPTTGIYLDDTPLQKRDNPGSASGNGTPFPQLFDLERVEVLRGPQGTLYGSSAEGGAVRFITPAPSLTKESVYAKAQASKTEGGGWSWETGVALGGPIVKDKLGFRASVFRRHTGGYIDEVSLYDSHTVAPDVNSGDGFSTRVAVTWAPTANLKLTPAFYYSEDRVRAQDIFWETIPAYTVNSGTFTNAGVVNGVRFDFPDRAFTGGTYGPFNQFGPGKSGNALYFDAAHSAGVVDSPRRTRMVLPTLTVDYAWPHVTLKSITSAISDDNQGYTGGQVGERSAILPTQTNSGFVDASNTPVPGGLGSAPLFLPGFSQLEQEFHFSNSRQGLVQEFRFSSDPDPAPISWVGGVYLSRTFQHQFTYAVGNEDAASVFLRGISEAWLLGTTNFPGSNTSQRDLRITETEAAVFGDVNFAITPRLILVAGVRVAREEINLKQQTGSSVQGAPAGFSGTPATGVVSDPACGADPRSCASPTFHPFPNQPADDKFVSFHGGQVETPVTPKVGLSYRPDPHSLYYVSAAKGFRAGGLNQPVPVLTCSQDLNALGLTGTPLTYKSDSVWSYEAGAKVQALGGKAQINSSVFYIDWRNPQQQNRLRCGQNFIVNAGAAVSQGFDIQGQARFGRLTLSLAAAYTDAHYTKTYAIPGSGGAPIVMVNKGDRLGAPDWQTDLSLNYDFVIAGPVGGYVRADYQYSGPFQRGPGPGASVYDPAVVRGDPAHFVTLRLGMVRAGVDINLFANNLTNAQPRLYEAHTLASPLVTASTYRPREIGLQVSFRY
jgi:outer membrane receptor protein involved in Fe transport